MTLLATYALFLGGPHKSTNTPQNIFVRRAADAVCDDVHEARDQCAFVREYCTEDEPGLLSYLSFYYCVLPQVKPVAFILLSLWLALLFSTIGVAASDFFSINLSTIATVLGLPESLAGVTFLAFGNGSPDVFSTFAAMNSNSGSMAIGELLGAAGFITAVVAGSMALVREFKVSRKTFIRDIVFFIISVSFAMLFLLDGKMQLWECGSMIAFYVFYVFFVVMWHWVSTRRKRRRAKEAASRSHYSVASGHVGDDVEQYHDDVDDDEEEEDGTTGHRGRSEHVQDISALESGPRINVDGSSQDDDDDDDKNRHVASEMTSNMRVNRPRGRRTHSTITPIRPSLVGALEFRSVISSLAKSRNMRMAPLTRGYSDIGGTLARSSSDLGRLAPYRDDPSTSSAPQSFRDRALSSGDTPRHLHNETMQDPPLFEDVPSQPLQESIPSASASHKRDGPMSVAQRAVAAQDGSRERRPSSPTKSFTRDGHLAPPEVYPRPVFPPVEPILEQRQSSTPALSLQIPSPNLQPSQASSPSLSPFPCLHESPITSGQQSPKRPNPMQPVPRVETYDHIPGLCPPDSPKPVSWWPYYALPPPHMLWRTLMPTLQDWRGKSIWDKVFSIFSLPSVFLLVITLPVVETEIPDDEDEDDDALNSLGVNAPAIAIESEASIVQETEWQEYRRRSRSVSSQSPSPSRRKPNVGTTPTTIHEERFPDYVSAGVGPYGGQPVSEAGLDSEPSIGNEPPSWNRWLVAVQIFTGPLFTTFIIWSKYMDQPAKTLVKMILYSLLGSLILLAILLVFTTPDKKPKYHFLFCFLGFIISIAWISTIAEEVVGVLKAVGVILGMSEAILGLTVFAVGNSVGDLVADITVARLGYPVMALYVHRPPPPSLSPFTLLTWYRSACFGGPMLNILLGIGLGGTYMIIKSAKEQHEQYPDQPLQYKSYHIEVAGTLFVSALTVLVTLVVLLIMVPSNKWVMTRRIGLTLIALWSVGTIINVIVEATGIWKAVA